MSQVKCSPKFCDNLLVEAGSFTILGVSIYVTQNTLNFIKIKNKGVRAQFKNSSIPLCCHFFIGGVVCSIHVAHFFPRCDGSVVIFIDDG